MKDYLLKLTFILMILTLLPTNALSEKRWVWGRIKGNPMGEVVTMVVMDVNDPGHGYQAETSTNKFGDYAFSDAGQGSPSNYKLIIYVGDQMVKQLSLRGIRIGGRIPTIRLGYEQ